MLDQLKVHRHRFHSVILGGLLATLFGCGAAMVSAAPRSLTIDTASLPSMLVGQAYSAQMQASGGAPGSYQWVASGLPQGVGINGNTGVISGTPQGSSGTVTITVTVTSK